MLVNVDILYDYLNDFKKLNIDIHRKLISLDNKHLHHKTILKNYKKNTYLKNK